MRSYITSAIVMLVVGLAEANAQIKLPVFDQNADKNRNVVFEDVSSKGGYRHGMLVRVNLTKEKEQIQGVLVRVDPSQEAIYVRTRPGTPPKAFTARDIARIDKGIVRHVDTSSDVIVPEIQCVVINNGLKRKVVYRGPTLSPAERMQLDEIQSAENELARLEYLTALDEMLLEEEIALRRELRKRQELLNDLIWRQLHSDVPTPTNLPNRVTISLLPWADLAWNGPPESLSANGWRERGALVKPEALTAARRAYMTALQHAVFEDDTLVAVLVKDQASTR